MLDTVPVIKNWTANEGLVGGMVKLEMGFKGAMYLVPSSELTYIFEYKFMLMQVFLAIRGPRNSLFR